MFDKSIGGNLYQEAFADEAPEAAAVADEPKDDNEIQTWVTENPMIVGGAAGGLVVLCCAMMCVILLRRKKK